VVFLCIAPKRSVSDDASEQDHEKEMKNHKKELERWRRVDRQDHKQEMEE
jgi:hypothetical protein